MNNPENSPISNVNSNHLFIFGLGYSAGYLARALLKQGWKISGTVRNPEDANELKDLGIKLYTFDGIQPMESSVKDGIEDGVEDGVKALQNASHILSSIPPNTNSDDPALEHHFTHIANNKNLQWIGYLSTTGVYGDRQGGWVDETSDLLPTGKRGQLRKDAEAAWFKLWTDHQIPTHSFRLAGIYGPTKNAIETVKSSKARRIHKEGQVFSRIHVEDIAQILEASMLRPNGGAAYNVCDDNPDAPEKVISYACELLGVEKPPLLDFETADLSPMARSFYGDNKRVSNQKIKVELGVNLKWPDYKTAFKALMEN